MVSFLTKGWCTYPVCSQLQYKIHKNSCSKYEKSEREAYNALELWNRNGFWKEMKMKRFLFMSIFIFFIMAHYSSAQMGHGTMRKTHDMEQRHMMEQEEIPGEKRMMMEHETMMGNMMGTTQDISTMMSEMSEMIGNMSTMSRDNSRGRMQKMSNIMKKMSTEMFRMSWMMDKGMVTDEEMKTMQERILKMQKQMSEIK